MPMGMRRDMKTSGGAWALPWARPYRPAWGAARRVLIGSRDESSLSTRIESRFQDPDPENGTRRLASSAIFPPDPPGARIASRRETARGSMDSLFQDIRFALRSLAKARGFTATVLLLLAIGIGTNTAMFSVVDAVFLRALPYRDADRLMLVHRSQLLSDQRDALRVQEFHAIKERAGCFEELAGVSPTWFTVLQGNTSEHRHAARVTVEYFRLLDAKPLLGRTFEPGDAEADHLVVLSYRLWKEGFGGDPWIVVKLLSLNLRPHRVI